MLIGIAGKKGAGKDTLGRMFQAHVCQAKGKLRDEVVLDIIQEPVFHPQLNMYSGLEIKKFAGKLKEVAGLILGVDPRKFEDADYKSSTLDEVWNYNEFEGAALGWVEKEMTVRKFLQKLGTDAIRNGLHPNAWVNSTFSHYNENSNWIITDVRFPNEAEAIRQRGGIMLRINRAELNSGDNHASETALDNYKYYNEVVPNNGTLADLYEWVLAWDGLDEYINQQLK